MLVSTSYDRKIKILDALTGEFIDSFKKGNHAEPVPVSFEEREDVKKRIEEKEKMRSRKKKKEKGGASGVCLEYEVMKKQSDYT